MKLTPTDLETLAPGIDAPRYYDAWSLLVILWRSLWFASRTDWGRYRARIWDMFGDRVRAAARMGRGLDGFLAHVSRSFDLAAIGANEDERQTVAALLALPEPDQRQIVYQLRNNLPVLLLLLRLYRDQRKAEMEALDAPFPPLAISEETP